MGRARGRATAGASRSAGPRRTSRSRRPSASTTRPARRSAWARTSRYIKACHLDEDNDRAIEEGERPLTNFIHFNVAPTDSLDRTPEGKQKLIDARYEFYAADDFPNTRKLSYQQLLDLNVVYAGSPDKVAEQLIDLQDQFRFDEFLLIANYGGNKRWQAMRNQELFMTQVAPRMREAYAKMSKKSAVAAA